MAGRGSRLPRDGEAGPARQGRGAEVRVPSDLSSTYELPLHSRSHAISATFLITSPTISLGRLVRRKRGQVPGRHGVSGASRLSEVLRDLPALGFFVCMSSHGVQSSANAFLANLLRNGALCHAVELPNLASHPHGHTYPDGWERCSVEACPELLRQWASL